MSDDTQHIVVDPAEVMLDLEAARRDGTLTAGVAGWPRYQASASRPGMMERVDSDGCMVIGIWRDSSFVAVDM